MIVVRDIFQIQPDQMKKAKELARQAREILGGQGYSALRGMTDLTGEYYTMVWEGEYESLADFEAAMGKAQANKKWQKFYPGFRKLIRGGRREIFQLLD